MQTLTIPASVSKRKQACRNCRHRKKKCDAERPECSLCKKLGSKCEYSIPVSDDWEPVQIPKVSFDLQANVDPTLQLGQDDALCFMQFPGLNFNPALGPPPLPEDPYPIDYPTPESGMTSTQTENSIDFQGDLLASFQLPDDDLLLELVDLFFENLYPLFPCFHKQSFMTNVQNGYFKKEAPLLLYAVSCIASRHHPDVKVRKRQGDWYEQAKFSYELTRRFPQQGLRAIQAVLLLIYHAFTVGDFSASWLFLGKAWRQVVALGMNRMDASGTRHPMGEPDTAEAQLVFHHEISRGRTAVEREEYRRSLWLLFICDRNHAWPTGWPNAINELQFKVDMPITGSLFQALDPELKTSPHNSVPFTRNLRRLIDQSTSAKDPLNLFHYIVITHVLLGRVTELIHSLHDSPDTPEYAEECQELDSIVVKFRLSLLSQATSIIDAPSSERGHAVWLNAMLNLVAIILHYRCADGVPVPNAAGQFALAVGAARSIAQVVKDASRFSIDLLMSAHISSSLYVAACLLVIQWRITGDDSLKEDIDLLALVFERMSERFIFLGIKFKLALEHDLQKDEESILRLRDRGFSGMLADCSKWSFVKDEVMRRGMNIAIT